MDTTEVQFIQLATLLHLGHDLTQRDLAAIVGRSPTTIKRMKKRVLPIISATQQRLAVMRAAGSVGSA